MADQVKLLAESRRGLPSIKGEGAGEEQVRMNRRGELFALLTGKGPYAMADEGSYWVATNPTPGTAIAGIAATGGFSDQESLLYVKNNTAVGSGLNLYLDFLELLSSVAGTNGTNVRYVSKIDGPSANRIGSGGSAITAINVLGGESAPSILVQFGAVATAVATSAAKLVGNGLIRNVITVVGDKYTFDFGGAPRAPAHAVAGTAIADIVIPHVPVVLPPQYEFVLSIHAASQTVASEYEFILGGWLK